MGTWPGWHVVCLTCTYLSEVTVCGREGWVGRDVVVWSYLKDDENHVAGS